MKNLKIVVSANLDLSLWVSLMNFVRLFLLIYYFMSSIMEYGLKNQVPALGDSEKDGLYKFKEGFVRSGGYQFLSFSLCES